MDSSEETALVRRLARMDERAWEMLCGCYGRSLLACIQLGFGCSADRAEEIVQRAFVRCVRSIGSFDPSRGRLFPWLKAIAANEARTCLGTANDEAAAPLSAIPEHVLAGLAEMIDRSPLPDEIIVRDDTRQLVRRCLASLNERQRDVLILKYVEGLKMSEIAQRMETSEKAVESLLSRSREALRSAILAECARQGTPAPEILG